MSFGERLREARTKAGFSQAELTKRSGVPKTMLSRYENDHILPSITTLGKLGDALGLHAAALLGEGSVPSHAFAEGLSARGVDLDVPQAKQLAAVVADMVEQNDARVSFMQARERRIG